MNSLWIRNMTIGVFPVMLLGIAGCAHLHGSAEQQVIDAASMMPEHYAGVLEQAESAPSPAEAWWTDFGSQELNAFVLQAFEGNVSLLQTEARLRQAAATARKAGAGLFPALSASTGAGITHQRLAPYSATGLNETLDTENYSLGVSASYELDVWGRVRSSRNAASYQAIASAWDVQSASVSISASVVSTWLTIVEAKQQEALLKKQIKTNRTLVDLLEQRQRNGASRAMDVYQQKATWASTRSLLPQTERDKALALSELNILLGVMPGTLDVASDTLPELPPLPSVGIPSALLERRPDVKAARERLLSSGFSEMAAKADRLPAFSITASAAYNDDEFSLLFDNWLLNLAGNLTMPLLDAGRRRAEVERTQAVVEEAAAAYKAVLLTSMQDVSDALIAEQKWRDQIGFIETQLENTRRALDEAQLNYRSGGIDYLNVLSALTGVQQLERTLLAARRALLVNRVTLYRALGGGSI
ncbi:MAG: efflux transporter outer membrane subunit [Spartobacteria bacterium]|nr:efflux transporter outer membrane subunit [Spartobacteria bacterium]